MQKCKVTVRLNGSLNNTVAKSDVTPAEILVLKAIHGDDAVVDIRPVEFDKKVRNEDVLADLRKRYERKRGGFVSQPGEEQASIIGRLFPGALPQLPKTLSEIGLADIDPEAIAQEPVKRGRGTKAKEEPAAVVEPVVESKPEPEAAEEGENENATEADAEAEETKTGLNFGATGEGEGAGEA